MPREVTILGRGLRLDLDAHVLSISWEVVVCGVPTTSEAPFWKNCGPVDNALDIYLNEYVQVLSIVQPSM